MVLQMITGHKGTSLPLSYPPLKASSTKRLEANSWAEPACSVTQVTATLVTCRRRMLTIFGILPAAVLVGEVSLFAGKSRIET